MQFSFRKPHFTFWHNVTLFVFLKHAPKTLIKWGSSAKLGPVINTTLGPIFSTILGPSFNTKPQILDQLLTLQRMHIYIYI